MFDYQRLVHTKWRFYNKCWGDIINGVTTNIIFLQKNKAYRTKSVCENPYDTSKYLVL